MAAIDPGLYEASRIDGASRFRQMWHITLPSIRSVIVVLLILKIGDVLELGSNIFISSKLDEPGCGGDIRYVCLYRRS